MYINIYVAVGERGATLLSLAPCSLLGCEFMARMFVVAGAGCTEGGWVAETS